MNFIENLNTIAGWVWINTLKASVLVGIILIIQILFRRRLTAKWHYALWLVLIARLLLPSGFESQLSIYNLIETRPESIKKISQPFTRIVWQSPEVLPIEENIFDNGAPVSRVSLKVADILVMIWAIGVIVLLGLTINGNRKFWLKIRSRQPVIDSAIQPLFNSCLEQMQIRRRICLQHLPAIRIPMVYGWFRPAILLPSAFIKDEKTESLKHILCHELAHIKRHDILVSYVTTLLQILHWFNPLMWWTFYKIRLDREVACDAIALNHLGREQAKSYGHTILSLLEHISTENLLPITVGIIESKRNLKCRLARIIQFKKPKIIWSLLAILIFSTITVAGLSEALSNEKNYKNQENDYFQSEDTVSTALQKIVIEGKDKIFFQADSMNVMRSDSTVSILNGDSIILVTDILKGDSNKQEIITGRNVSIKKTDQNQIILTGYDIKIDTVDYKEPEVETKSDASEIRETKVNYDSIKNTQKEPRSSWFEKMLKDSNGNMSFKDFKTANPDSMFQTINGILSLFNKNNLAYILYLSEKKLEPEVDYWIEEGPKLKLADHIKIEKNSEIRLQWYPQPDNENEIEDE